MAAASLPRVGKEERQVGGSEVEHAIGQVAARLIPERQHALFDQPENVLAAIAEVEDVVDVLHLDRVAKAGFEPIADLLERQAEAGGGRPVPAHQNPDPPFGGAAGGGCCRTAPVAVAPNRPATAAAPIRAELLRKRRLDMGLSAADDACYWLA